MRVLMCRPAFYGIEYEINPWMNRSRKCKYTLAQEQWRALYRLLKKLHVRVSLIDPRPGLPDMVFTANAGFVWANKFILSNFRHQVRRAEAAHFERWFAARHFEIFQLAEQHFFEGEGDLLMCGEVLFAGYPFRSSFGAHRQTAAIIEREIISLKLTDEWFYHLDTCFCPLSSSVAMYYPAAFDAKALKDLTLHIPTLIPVDQEEARRFACNAVVIENNVIINHGCPKIRGQLESMGFSVSDIPFGEFIKAGGSAKCLVLQIPHLAGLL